MRHFINTAANISLARSLSLLAPLTPRSFGPLVVGTARNEEFFFHADGAVEPWSGAAGYGLRLTLGPVDADPPTFQAIGFAPVLAPVPGWAGVVNLDDAALGLLLRARGDFVGDMFQCTTLLTVEVLDPAGFSTVYFQSSVVLRALNYSGLGGGPVSPLVRPAFYSLPLITGLASAVADLTKLGGLTTATGQFPAGATVQAIFPDNLVVLFSRVATVAAQNVPRIVRPFDFDPVTNPYQWRINRVFFDGQPCSYNADTGRWHYLVAQGPVDAVTLGPDQVGVALPA